MGLSIQHLRCQSTTCTETAPGPLTNPKHTLTGSSTKPFCDAAGPAMGSCTLLSFAGVGAVKKPHQFDAEDGLRRRAHLQRCKKRRRAERTLPVATDFASRAALGPGKKQTITRCCRHRHKQRLRRLALRAECARLQLPFCLAGSWIRVRGFASKHHALSLTSHGFVSHQSREPLPVARGDVQLTRSFLVFRSGACEPAAARWRESAPAQGRSLT